MAIGALRFLPQLRHGQPTDFEEELARVWPVTIGLAGEGSLWGAGVAAGAGGWFACDLGGVSGGPGHRCCAMTFGNCGVGCGWTSAEAWP